MDAKEHAEHKDRIEAEVKRLDEYLRRLEQEVVAVKEHLLKHIGKLDLLKEIEPKGAPKAVPESPEEKPHADK